MDDGSARDEQLIAIVDAALKLNAGEREGYLRSACGSDPKLLEEAAETVEWEGRMDGFLRKPLLSFPQSGEPFEPGETVCGRFTILRKIGEGGMGVVYEAFDNKRNQPIAIKAAKPGFGTMLSPELEGALRVRHTNVCLVNEIHTAQTAAGLIDFLTMELLQGETLSARLARLGKLPPPEAEKIGLQLCAGLKEAHRSGVIHRDLKPGNIILCSEAGSRAVITDFGLCGEACQSGFFGTQRYLAPELLLGQKASRASDIYALGVILYEMVAGVETRDSGSAVPQASANAAALPQASRAYRKLIAEFLSLQPERRCLGFETAPHALSHHTWSRRELFSATAASAVAVAAGWLERERFSDWLQPLPRKRFVVLLPGPPITDQKIRPIVTAAIDAIENELARAESTDRNLFVTSAHESVSSGKALGEIGSSLGVNLALQASAAEEPDGVRLLLKLVDISSGALLRKRQITCASSDVPSLPSNAVECAASLLNVRWNQEAAARLKPGTDSASALRSFQAAEELRKKPNDDGLSAAIDQYKKALDADPKFAAAYTQLSIAYRRSYAVNADSAVLALARGNALRAIELDPNSASAHLALAMVHSAEGNFNAAQNEMRLAFQLDPGNPRYLLWQAQIYRHFHRWQLAEQTFRKLQQERPNYWISYNDLGALLTDVGRYREAMDSFRVASVAAPGSALVWNNLGTAHFRLAHLAQAEEAYRRSIALKPSDAVSLNLGEVLRVQGKFAEAEAACKQAVKLSPASDDNWLGLADCYEAMGGHQKEASDAFAQAAAAAEQLLAVEPNNSAAWVRLALYRLKTGAIRDPSALLRRAEESNPLDLDSSLLKVRVLELAGNRKSALNEAADCLRRGPVHFQISTVPDLKALARDPHYSRLLQLPAGTVL
jgi:eukaryotic-like serine/threonine-protein kinase